MPYHPVVGSKLILYFGGKLNRCPFQLIFLACGGTAKGITFKDLLCSLVLLTRGIKDEKIKCE